MEVLGRYSNLSDQGERIHEVLQEVPLGPPEPQAPTPKQIQRRLREDEIRDLVAGYQAGSTVYELAEQFRIRRNTVSALLERQGVPRRLAPLSASEVDQAIALYKEGWSLARVGERLDCNPGTVWRALRKAGLKLRDCHGRERTSSD